MVCRMAGEEWIVKFPTSFEGKDSGKMEYDYAICAKNCGIEMEEVRFLPSALCEGYFATKRFDRRDGKRFHMISVSGYEKVEGNSGICEGESERGFE